MRWSIQIEGKPRQEGVRVGSHVDPTRTFLGCKMGSKKKSSKGSAKRPLASFLASLRVNLTNMAVTVATSAVVYYGLVVARKLT